MGAYLLIGIVLVLLVMAGGARSPLRLPTWRIGSAMGAVFAFAGAGYMAVREVWPASMVLAVLGIWMAVSARFPRPEQRAGSQSKASRAGAKPPAERRGRMSEAEARSILGVEPGASRDDIQAAYTRLMKRAHPDAGGSPGLAAQLNAARDRLLKG